MGTSKVSHLCVSATALLTLKRGENTNKFLSYPYHQLFLYLSLFSQTNTNKSCLISCFGMFWPFPAYKLFFHLTETVLSLIYKQGHTYVCTHKFKSDSPPDVQTHCCEETILLPSASSLLFQAFGFPKCCFICDESDSTGA